MKVWPIVPALVACFATAGHLHAQGGARPVIGVAFGGGSARGFAHVGVIRWFEEHRIPIDRVAGTSMGALIGASYATGMSADEITALIDATDWDMLFGPTPYNYKSIPRKEDARKYPSRLQFHMRRGVGFPSALNNGEEVDLLLSRVGAVYSSLPSFDALPTPFRCVATDLRTGAGIVLDSGSLPQSMRASMSLPGIFPPIEIGKYVFVDGGAMDNVPANVVRSMGADVVIAIPVGFLRDTNTVAFSMFGLVSNTIGALMRANTRRGMKGADIVVHPDLTGLTSEDWYRSDKFAEAGYRAAEGMRAKLLPLALDSAAWRQYLAERAEKRKRHRPRIVGVDVRGASPRDERRIVRRMQRYVGRPLAVEELESDLRGFSGEDRYLTIGWDLAEREGGETYTLVIRARPYASAPPLLMSTVNIENRTSAEFLFQLASRFLAFDMLTHGSELRVDATLGTDPLLGAEFRQSISGTPLFVAATAVATRDRVDFTRDDAIIAQYDEDRYFGGVDVGITISRDAELRAGVRSGYYDADVRVGNPGLPAVSGPETMLAFRGIYDAQDNAVVPSEGLRVVAHGRHTMDAPDVDLPFGIVRSNEDLYQAELEGSMFLSWRDKRERVFALAGGGSSFGHDPLPTAQFVLGVPLRLDAFYVGERRGDYFAALTLGFLHVIGHLPTFLGGPTLVGAWLQNGSAWDDADDVHVDTQLGIGAVTETLIGPGLIGYSFGSGAHRFYIGFGRLFR